MAILDRSNRYRPTALRVLFLAALLSGSGCLVLEQIGWNSRGLAFDHAVHVLQEEMECIDCHMEYEDGDEPGMPPLEDCLLCHEEPGDDMPLIPVADFYTDEEGLEYRVVGAHALSEEIVFSHLGHVTDEEGCLDCHASVVESDEVRPWMKVDMDGCTSCHAEREVASSCASCHEEIRLEVAPWTHDGVWDKRHGLSVRDGSELTADRCILCHDESTCATCHQETPPDNHGNHWRRRGHGLTASLDRQNCAACHQPDYCDRCHRETTPMSHHGLWGGTRNTHCFGCHLGGSEPSCNLCHDGAPSHAMAPLLPPGHDPMADCRSCHLILQHVDKGDSCTICHN
jgi:hypothetical protein